MGDADGLSIGVKIGIALGCFLGVILVAGGVIVLLNRRKLDRKRIEEANRPADKEKLVRKELSEGNPFGGRAVQHGHYGSSVTPRPSSPSPSYLLAPDAQLIDWSKESRAGSSASSISSFPRAQIKSSPLRLEVQDPKYNPSSVGGMGGSYMPPLPSPRTNRAESPMFNEPKPTGWVSPLDVHFSRPSTPGGSGLARPTSYLPRLNLDFGQNGTLMVPSNEAKSEVASIVSSEVATPAPAMLKSPGQPTFPSQLPTVRAAQKSLRSIFPTENQPDKLGSPKGGRFESPPVPLKDLSPRTAAMDSGKFPQDNRQWNPASGIARDVANNRSPAADRRGPRSPAAGEFRMQPPWTPTSPTVPDSILDAEWDRSRPIIRDSAVSKQRVSVVRPTGASQIETVANQKLRQSRRHSVAASSLYSNETSILDTDNRPHHERVHSHTADFEFSRNRSLDTIRQSSTSRSALRSQNSVRHSRSVSDESLIRFSRNGSEPRPFDRESPFSNSHATSDNSHSVTSSFSSYRSTMEAPAIPSHIEKTQPSLPDLENFPFPASSRPLHPRGFEFALTPNPSDHLRVVPNNHGRSTSEVSQASIGDFYDSYYRQSGMAQSQEGVRNSVQAQVQGFNSRFSPAGNMPMREPPRRPAPLNLSKLGQKYAGNEMIVEVATPNTGAFGPVGLERFPARI